MFMIMIILVIMTMIPMVIIMKRMIKIMHLFIMVIIKGFL